MNTRRAIRLLWFIGIVLMLVLTVLTAQAQTIGETPFAGEFTQSYSPKDRPLKVSEPIEIVFTFKHSIDEEVLAPESLPSTRWHLIDSDTQTQPLNGSEKKTTLKMRVSVNRPGATTLAPLRFTILDRGGKSSTVEGQALKVKFISILPDKLDLSFKAPRPPVEIWVEDYTLAWFGGIGLIGLLFLGLYLFMKSREEILVIPQPPRSAHDIALKKLGEVAGFDNAADSDENMAFYVRVSEAIREYMGTIWGFPGTELTTTEILKHLRQKTFPLGLSQDDIGQFLNETDYVKFAGSRPDEDANARILRRAFSIIELTKSLSNSRHTAALTKFREIHGSLDASEGQDGSVEGIAILSHSDSQTRDSSVESANFVLSGDSEGEKNEKIDTDEEGDRDDL